VDDDDLRRIPARLEADGHERRLAGLFSHAPRVDEASRSLDLSELVVY
jgi:hypothetical protein